MKLISMTEFVMMQNINFANKDIDINQLALRNLLYAQLLTQPLTLEMFVPTDLDGNVLEDGMIFPANLEGSKQAAEYTEQYQQAKDRVLFEGEFGFNENKDREKDLLNVLKSSYPNIESLVDYDEVTLTQTAIKQIGL